MKCEPRNDKPTKIALIFRLCLFSLFPSALSPTEEQAHLDDSELIRST